MEKVGSDQCVVSFTDGTCPDSGLQTTAFRRPDGQVAVVVMNCADNDATDVAIEVGSQKVLNSVPAHSVQTYLFPSV